MGLIWTACGLAGSAAVLVSARADETAAYETAPASSSGTDQWCPSCMSTRKYDAEIKKSIDLPTAHSQIPDKRPCGESWA